ncbi:MAG: chitobiase/beta-hexosaminidase C-terminal domain-containing protein [Methanobacterium sp. ERen5]|nr:MAG: chitobiase/beta-hexosaminidase C-terminal domain-containing protein [Methanobacterium sp. ERen5]
MTFSFSINFVSATNPSTIYVSTHGNDSWTGLNSTWIGGTNGPKATIKNATGTVNVNGMIKLANGIYKENNININTNISIVGENQAKTLINGTNSGLIFHITSGVEVLLKNLTFSNCNETEGGVVNNQGLLKVDNCTFTDNTAQYGGAINNNYATLNLNHCTFLGNIARGGGALYNMYGNMNINDTTFTNNTAYQNWGGAIWSTGNTTTSVNITQTSFNYNTAKDCVGGAIFNGATMNMYKCNFLGNFASSGGGAIGNFGNLNVTSCNFMNNSGSFGGAIENHARCAVTGSNIIDNKDKTYLSYGGVGGAIYNEGTNGLLTLRFNRIFGNSGAYQSYSIYNSDGTIDASLNWWGSNDNPLKYTNPNCITLNSWLILNVTPNPVTIGNNAKSTITALLTDNHGNPVSDYLPDGIPVSFTTTLGAIVDDHLTMINGVAYTTLYSGVKFGVATVTTRLDYQTVTTLLEIKDIIPPKVLPNPLPGIYNTKKTVYLILNEPGKIYYTLNGTIPMNTSTEYDGPITIKNTTVIKYFAIDSAGNQSRVFIATYTIDIVPPSACSNVQNGTYNTNKIVNLTMTKNGTIYYTLNGKTPTTISIKYNGPITIKSTTTLKYQVVDMAGNKSPIYTNIYKIDKTAPKVESTTPTKNTKNVSLTAPITIKFSEKIVKSVNFTNIYIKNLKTGKIAKSTITSINGNTLTLKMTKSRLSLNNYQIVIPTGSVKDTVGNNNSKYLLNFKTSKY